MKLLDLLVKKTNEEGWSWPRGALGAHWIKSIKKVAFIDSDGYIPMHIIMHQFHDIDSDETETLVTKSQYESALAASDGWIEWGGGECPVDIEEVIDIKFRGGEIKTDKAFGWRWSHDNNYWDIIAYRQHRDINSLDNDDRLEQDLNECIGQDVNMPEWNGDGLPPVGCEFEFGAHRRKAKCLAVAHHMVFASKGDPDDEDGEYEEFMISIQDSVFFPLRTEAEKAREKLAASLHIAAGASPIELNGIGPLYFKLADAIISGSVFGTTFKADK